MKKTAIYILKCIVAGIISLVVLSVFSVFFYNPPLAVTQPDKTTDNKFVPGRNWSYMLEGYGYGTTDSLGYNNAYYPQCTDPDIVFMGSSHMEALQVPQDSNCVYLLNKMFDTDAIHYNDFKCLNLGVSGHFFEVSLSNFENVAKKFSKTEYIVIETFNVDFSSDVLDKIANGEVQSTFTERSGITDVVRNIPYIRLLYKKIQEAESGNGVQDNIGAEVQKTDIEEYVSKMNIILSGIKDISEKYGKKVVILMHDRISEDENGRIFGENDGVYTDAFKKCCNKNGIKVADVVPRFISEYRNTSSLPYGYANSVPGTGHLNKLGHSLIAEELYELFNDMAVK